MQLMTSVSSIDVVKTVASLKLTNDEGAIPMNISTIVDLLEQKNISWASCECICQ